MIPSFEECLQLMDKYHMLENIKAHSLMVERVAMIIATGLNNAGAILSLKRISAGALLHDIGKTSCLDTKIDHAPEGMDICIDNNFKEIAPIVNEHIRLKSFDKDGPVLEKEVVYYSDKRVNHDQVVSLEDRIEYLIHRYAKGDKDLIRRIEDNFAICRQVETKIFNKLDLKPNDLQIMANRHE